MTKGKGSLNINCQNPDCDESISVEVNWYDDPGVRWHRDGSGTPPDSGWEIAEPFPTSCKGGHPVTEEYVTAQVDKQIDSHGFDGMQTSHQDEEDWRADEAYDRDWDDRQESSENTNT